MWKTKLCLGVVGGTSFTDAEQIKLFKDAGFDGFFVGWRKDIDLQKIANYATSIGMKFQSVHAPFGGIDKLWHETEETAAVLGEQLQCLQDSAAAGVFLVVCHAFIGFDRHEPTEAGIKNFDKIVTEAERLGVKIAFENTEGEEYLAALMTAFEDRKNVGFCWDTGHEMCYNHGKDMLALYGNKLLATHLNDNLGIRDYEGNITWIDDLHLLPFDGIADWENIAARMVRCGYDGDLTFELNIVSKPNRHENDLYAEMPFEKYLVETYKRACKVAALKCKSKGENQ